MLIYFTICVFTDVEGFAEGDILGRSGAAWSVKSLPVWAWGIGSGFCWPAVRAGKGQMQGLQGNACFYFQSSWGVGQ